MRLFIWFCCMQVCCLTSWSASTLRSSDTAVTVLADNSAPRVLEVRGAGNVWVNAAADPLIADIFIDGKPVPVRWRFDRSASASNAEMVRFVYESATPHLRLDWVWRRRAALGPIEHTIHIENLTGRTILLPLKDSLYMRWHVPASRQLENFWVEKGAGGPSDVGSHLVRMRDGYAWTGTSSTYAHPGPGQPREMIPYTLLEGPGGRGMYLGIEFSGRTRITVARSGNAVTEVAGLNPEPGPFRTRLMPGESFDTPVVFLGSFAGGPDGAANILRRWVRQVLDNPVTVADPHYPLVVNNSWGSGMAIDAEQARKMIRDSAALGFEMFHLDAGWFRGVGDWVADPKKFPGGLTPIADYAHSFGLRFGLWMDWAQAGLDDEPGALYVRDPKIRDWLTSYPPENWKPLDAFKGVTIDLGLPAAHDWAAAEVGRVVRDNHLDMLEHDGYVVAQGCDRRDHPHVPPNAVKTRHFEDSGFPWVESTNDTDVSYHATRAYYDIYAKLRAEHPKLLLEICNDGGRMVDFGSAAHGDYFSISDAYDPLANRRAFYDASYMLPPAMLEDYVMKAPTPTIANFKYMLRSGMMGWFTLMLDTTEWTPEQRAAAAQAIALYKAKLRPLIREADVYHVSPRPDGVHWDGMEFFDGPKRRGVLYAFRGSQKDEPAHAFVLHGLDPKAKYTLHFEDGSSADSVQTGRELMREGVTVRLPEPQSSELVFFEAP